MRPILLLLVCLAWTSAGEAVITIDPTTVTGPINRLVLGGNLESEPSGDELHANRGGGVWDPEHNAPVPAMMAALRRAGVTSLRYPGGCWAHYWDWRKAVGPVAQRPNKRFGVPEFLRVCAELGAEPVITLPDFLPAAEEVAVLSEFAEYLRAPPGRNSTGGTDAAALRVSDGHNDPWPVVRLEYGNEGFHGGHHDFAELFSGHLEQRSPADYVRRYRAVRAAIRAVDPRLQVGAVLDNELSAPWTPWTRTVIAGVGGEADFMITHLYYPIVSDADAPGLPIPAVFRAAFSAPRQLSARLQDLRRYIHTTAGRDVPLAITEFNANFSLRTPELRFSLGAAIEALDIVRMLLEMPGIDSAHYWESTDGYWGSLSLNHGLRARPAHLTQSLLNRHLGKERLATTVTCGVIESNGGWGVLPARGTAGDEGPLAAPRATGVAWTITPSDGVAASVVDDVLHVDIRDATREIDWYQASQIVGLEPADRWRVTAEVRCQGLATSGVQLQVGDVRGWEATKSAALSEPVAAHDWTTISVDYLPLHDTTAISINARRRASREAGTIEIRNLRIQPWRNQSLGATPVLSTLATRVDATSTAVVVINRSLDAAQTVRIAGVHARSAQAELVTGPSVDATNEVSELVHLTPLTTTIANGDVTVVLPPHSVAGVTLLAP